MATAADWMSAASFISMAGLIAFSGYDASVYLMGWTGGYVLLALLLAPYLSKGPRHRRGLFFLRTAQRRLD
jgi:cation/acetate symporter